MSSQNTVLVTGGAGFIGSNFVLDWIAATGEPVVNLDALTYAGNRENLALARRRPAPRLRPGRHLRPAAARRAARAAPAARRGPLRRRKPRRPQHPRPGGVRADQRRRHLHLLEAARQHWSGLPEAERSAFRFLHVSTDEVYGSLAPDDPAFTETHPHAPNSPYSASKAASDHLVRAWHHTYGLPVLTTNCSNNYGPYHFPEKLIPLMIVNALAGKPLPVYGDGMQVRDWLYVKDHCAAIREVLARGRVGETYNIGGWNEKPNVEIVETVCALLDELRPDPQAAVPPPGQARDRPARPRPALRDRCAQDRARARLAAAGDLRDRPAQDRALVSRPCRLGRAGADRRLSRLALHQLQRPFAGDAAGRRRAG